MRCIAAPRVFTNRFGVRAQRFGAVSEAGGRSHDVPALRPERGGASRGYFRLPPSDFRLPSASGGNDQLLRQALGDVQLDTAGCLDVARVQLTLDHDAVEVT